MIRGDCAADVCTTWWDGGAGTAWEEHVHPWAELLWDVEGQLQVDAAGVRHLVRPGGGLLLPDGVPHAVRATGRFAVTYLDAPADRALPLRTTPALVELLRHLGSAPAAGAGGAAAAGRRVLEAAALELVSGAPVGGGTLRMPTDERTRPIVAALLADPADDRSLAVWAHRVGAGVRTLSRIFVGETGRNFVQWRIELRMAAAAEQLAAGVAVAVVARRVGYDSPSAFASVYRRVTGRTPTGHPAGDPAGWWLAG